MKIYLIFTILFFISHASYSAQQADQEIQNEDYPFHIQKTQRNKHNLTLYLDFSGIENFQFFIMSMAQQAQQGIKKPKTTSENILCIGTNQNTHAHIQFSSSKPVDCTRATIKHKIGSPHSFVRIPFKK